MEREFWLPSREWANIAFTDEMSVDVGAVFGTNLVWGEKGEEWHDDCVGTKKKTGTSVMCWGMISRNWKGPFHVWAAETKEEKEQAKREIAEWNARSGEEEEELNTEWRATEEFRVLKEGELRAARELRAAAAEWGAEEKIKTTQSWRGKKYKIKKLKRKDAKGVDSWRYVTSLCRPLLWPTCRERLALNPDFLLMEDNAPSHDSDFTNLERRKEGIEKIAWPPNSSDFNPIKHIWHLMKMRILRRLGSERIRTPLEMKIVLEEECSKITIEEINHEIVKLPDIIVRCIAKKGGNNFQA